MSHHCHATECPVAVPPEMFMCRRHWFWLPKSLRDRIWRAYRAGQCDDYSMVSNEYAKVTKEAVEYIAAKEGKAADTRLQDMFIKATEAK